MPYKNKSKAREWHQKNLPKLREKYRIRKSSVVGYIDDLLFRGRKKTPDTDIDREFLVSLFRDIDYKCQITGISFEYENNSSAYHNPKAPSLDQINPGDGYYRDNVQLVLLAINRMKSNMKNEEFLQLLREVSQGVING